MTKRRKRKRNQTPTHPPNGQKNNNRSKRYIYKRKRRPERKFWPVREATTVLAKLPVRPPARSSLVKKGTRSTIAFPSSSLWFAIQTWERERERGGKGATWMEWWMTVHQIGRNTQLKLNSQLRYKIVEYYAYSSSYIIMHIHERKKKIKIK